MKVVANGRLVPVEEATQDWIEFVVNYRSFSFFLNEIMVFFKTALRRNIHSISSIKLIFSLYVKNLVLPKNWILEEA